MTTSRNEIDIFVNAKDNASRTLDHVNQKAGGLGKTLGDVGKIAGGFLAAQAITAGAQKFTGFIAGSISAANDLGESINAVSQIFGDSADTILKWGDTQANAFGLSQRAFNQMATPMGAVLKNLGFEQDEVAKSTIELTKRAADMASVFNTDVEDALAAINSALRGEANPIERYGVSVNQTAVNLRALADTGKSSAAALTEQEKAAARLALIFEQTSAVAGDFANTSDQLANSQRVAAAKTEELQAELGQRLLPVMLVVTKVKLALVKGLVGLLVPAFDKVGQVLGKLTGENGALNILATKLALILDPSAYGDASKLGGFSNTVRTIFEALARDVGEVLQEISRIMQDYIIPAMQVIAAFMINDFIPAFKSGLEVIIPIIQSVIENALKPLVNFILENQPVLIAAIAAIGAAIVLALGPGAVAFVAITGLIALIGLVRDNWDELRAKTEEVFNSLPEPIQESLSSIAADVAAALESIRSIFDEVWPHIQSVVAAAVAFISENIHYLEPVFQFMLEDISTKLQGVAQVIQGLVGIVRGVIELIDALIHGEWSAAWEAAKGIVDSILTTIEGLFEASFGAIIDLILDLGSDAYNAARDFASEIVNGVKREIGRLPGIVADAVGDALNELNPLEQASRALGIDINPFQHGGVSPGGLALVGEAGRELVHLPKGSRVYSNTETERMLDSGSGGKIVVNNYGPVYARDEDDAHRAMGDIGWAVRAQAAGFAI